MERKKGKRLRIALYAAFGLAVLVLCGLATIGIRFTGYRSGYCNISLSDSKAEVMYRLGYPPYVYGKPVKSKIWDGSFNPVYTTDRSKDPKNAMPKGKKPTDFQEWSYTGTPGIGPSGRLDVSFEEGGDQVRKISCFGSSPESCPPLVGVHVGTTEETLTNLLGKPDSQNLDGVAKTVVYNKLGLEFLLTKDKVYIIVLIKPTRGRWYAALSHVKSVLHF